MYKKAPEQQIKEIVSLLESKKWEDAERALLELRKTNDGRVLFLLGMLFDEWENPNKNRTEAKRFFNLSIKSDNAPLDAFIQLARIETNRAHSVRILKKGKKSFPNEEQIYFSLINYSELSDREAIYFEAVENGCLSERIKISMAEAYFRLSKYEECLKLLSAIQIDHEGDREILKCMEGFCLYELGERRKASSIFRNLGENDINHQLEYIPTYGLILTLTSENKIPEAEKTAEELPLNIDAELFIGGPWGDAYFDAKEYRLKAINSLLKKTKSKEIKGRLRGIRGLFTYSEAFEAETTSKALQRSVIRDIEFAHELYPAEMRYLEHLFWINSDKNRDSRKAWKAVLKYVLNSDEDIYIGDFFMSISKPELKDVVDEFIVTIEETPYKAEKLVKTLLAPILSRLHKEKDYKSITNIAQAFKSNMLYESDSLFEIAYAYSKIGNNETAKEYYLVELRKDDDSDASWNNLGVIYENEGKLLKAVDCYKKAKNINIKKGLYEDNLKRAERLLKEKDKEDFALRNAIEEYRNESPYVQSKVLDFYNHRNSDRLIICSYRQAPQYLKMSGAKATEFLKDLLNKKYFLKVVDHEYDTQSSVYKINPYLESELARIEESLKNEEELLGMCKRLNLNSLNLIGYDEALLNNIARISSEEMKLMLQRDLRENALAVILKQNKSALVLSGSIIEAILTDRVMAKGITKYRISNKVKNIANMNLNELLDIAEKERIIDSTMAHLAHGVRGYRNLIHPGVEKRKATIQVTDSNVELAWGIVKKLLSEIK